MTNNLKIENGQIHLDEFKLEGVTGYELRSSGSKKLAELTLKLIVKDSNVVLNHRTNNVDGNFSQSTK